MIGERRRLMIGAFVLVDGQHVGPHQLRPALQVRQHGPGGGFILATRRHDADDSAPRRGCSRA